MKSKTEQIGDVATKIGSGVTPKGGQEVYTDDGIPFIRSQNVLSGELSLSTVARIPKSIHDSMRSSKVSPGDVLLNITGASIGRSCVFPDNVGEANVNQHVCIIRTNDKVVPLYLSNFLNSKYGQKQINALQNDGNRQGLNYEQIKKMIFPQVTLEEQKRYCTYFSTWDSAISLEARAIDLLSIEMSAILNKITEHDQHSRLENICEFIRDGSHASHKDVEVGIPLLSAKDIRDGLVQIPSDCRRISDSDFNQIHKKYSIQNNDILITIVGTIGRVSMVTNYRNSFTLQRSVGILRLKSEFNPNFYKHYFNSISFQKELRKRVNQSAQPGIYLGKLADINVPIVNKSTQDKVGRYLDSLETYIQLRKVKLEKLKLQKIGIADDVFGERNV